jgi:hypothetical protein
MLNGLGGVMANNHNWLTEPLIQRLQRLLDEATTIERYQREVADIKEHLEWVAALDQRQVGHEHFLYLCERDQEDE